MIEPTKENIALYTLSDGFCVHCGKSRVAILNWHCDPCLTECDQIPRRATNIVCVRWAKVAIGKV